MARGPRDRRWRRLLVLLLATTGATLAGVKVRRRQLSGSMPRSWSELDPAAPASLRPEAEPVTAPPRVADETAAPERAADESSAPEPAADEPAAADETAAAETTAPEPGLTDRPVPGPYPGSVLPLDDGAAPSDEFVIKGNAGSMRSHAPDSPYFGRTRAEVWFRTQDDAAAAGFEPWAPKR